MIHWQVHYSGFDSLDYDRETVAKHFDRWVQYED